MVKKTQETFIAEALEKHNGKYSYCEVDYINNCTKVKVFCETHGLFEISPVKHLAGQGCSDCGRLVGAKNRKITIDKFVTKANKVHSNKYCYDKVRLDGNKVKVEIVCSAHDSFWMQPTKHTQGRGCPKCSWEGAGYSQAKPGSLYILTNSEGLVKVGITNRTVTERVKGINRYSGKNFAVYYSMFCEDGAVARTLENKLLVYLRSKYKNPVDKFDGYTECFIGADILKLLELIQGST